MSSLGELLDYAKAKQPRNGLAEIASHFVEGASQGYDAGHAEALKKAETLRTDPMVTNPDTGAQVPVSVYQKLLDIKDKQLSIQDSNNFNAIFQSEVNAKDTAQRQTTLSGIAQDSMGPNLPPTTQGKIAGAVANPDNAGSMRRPTKMTMSQEGGKVKKTMEFADPKKETVQQLGAVKNYIDKNGDGESTTALLAAYPDGIPDKINEQILKSTQIKNQREEIASKKQEYKLGADIITYGEKLKKDPIIAQATKEGLALSQVDTLIQMAKEGNTVSASALGNKMARAMGEVGVLTDNDVSRYVRSGALGRGAADKLSKWISGTPTDATLDEIQQIGDAIRDRYNEKIQPVYNQAVERLSRNHNLTPDEAAYRLNVPYAPKSNGGANGAKTTGTPKKIGRFEVTVSE